MRETGRKHARFSRNMPPNTCVCPVPFHRWLFLLSNTTLKLLYNCHFKENPKTKKITSTAIRKRKNAETRFHALCTQPFDAARRTKRPPRPDRSASDKAGCTQSQMIWSACSGRVRRRALTWQGVRYRGPRTRHTNTRCNRQQTVSQLRRGRTDAGLSTPHMTHSHRFAKRADYNMYLTTKLLSTNFKALSVMGMCHVADFVKQITDKKSDTGGHTILKRNVLEYQMLGELLRKLW